MKFLQLKNLLLLVLAVAGGPHVQAEAPYLGIAYQTWNKPLGIWQTPAQLEYDLKLMASQGIHAARVEWVWGHIETDKGKFDFSNPDLLVKLAEKYQITLYPIIGFQWPPDWFEKRHLLGMMAKVSGQSSTERSPLLNYADPEVRKLYARFIKTVVSRYRGNSQIGAWILGNEFSYLDYASFRQLGYDPETEVLFHQFLSAKYHQALRNFDSVKLSELRIEKGDDGLKPGVHDFLESRRKSIADFVGAGCVAAKEGDPGAQRTYSSIGVLFSQFDQYVTSEDFRSIAEACRAKSAPLSFYSVNSYLNLNSRESFHLGLSYEMTKALTGLETVFTEFGLTSSEVYSNIGIEKQGAFLKAQYLEAIFDGVPKANVFTWTDKAYAAEREKGFGLLSDKRREKPAAKVLKDLESKLSKIDLNRLQASELKPAKRVMFLLQDREAFAQWNSYWNETWIVASGFKRLGLEVGFISSEELNQPEHRKGMELLVLSRQDLLPLTSLQKIDHWVKAGAFGVLAVSDVPGYGRSRADPKAFVELWKNLFGLEVLSVETAPELYGKFKLTTEGVSSALWQEDLLRPSVKGGAELSKEIATDQLSRSIPLYTVKDKAAFVPYSMGYLFDSDLSGKIIARLLNEVFHLKVDAKLRLEPLVRTRNLKDGGKLIYLQSVPELNKKGPLECSGSPSMAKIQVPPKTEWVSLASDQSWISSEQGVLAVELKPCASDLLIAKGSLAALQAAPSWAKVDPPSEAERQGLFPGRVWVDLDDAHSCAIENLKKAGYQRARLGIHAKPRLADWEIEPDKGYYLAAEHKADDWSAFETLVFADVSKISAGQFKHISDFLKADPVRGVHFGQTSPLRKLWLRLRYFPETWNQIVFEEMACIK